MGNLAILGEKTWQPARTSTDKRVTSNLTLLGTPFRFSLGERTISESPLSSSSFSNGRLEATFPGVRLDPFGDFAVGVPFLGVGFLLPAARTKSREVAILSKLSSMDIKIPREFDSTYASV